MPSTKPERLKEGDKVRLKDARLDRTMMVFELWDYDRKALCVWRVSPGEAGYDGPDTVRHDTYFVSDLVPA